MKKNIELSIEQARELLGKDPAMDVLIKANFTEDELKPKPKMGWFVGHYSEINEGSIDDDESNRNVFPYKSQAEGVLAMSQLAQKMAEVNGSWRGDWMNENQAKWCIVFIKCEIRKGVFYETRQFLAFPTAEICDKFLEDNLELIKEYGKIFKCE